MTTLRIDPPPGFVTIVTGLPRSGTSMVMQMLAAGGLPVHSDGARIVPAMGLKPSPSGEAFRFIYWVDGELPHGCA
ncbi:hypothetical protein Pla175_27670 [Pirellulimonas nuda]|uniref:Sulfotransferase family protein n=1 Tax=Pirellulimonas nuda TaxID=2528009 RepID=A0A518DD19_9BACT|nr:hypothetical protein Pla175_27670 [Pirellulimonas nuda]